MSRHFPPDEDDDEVAAVPVWRRPRVLAVAGVGCLALLFIFSRQPPPKSTDAPAKSESAFIGVVVPFSPAKADPTPPTAQITPAPPPTAPSAPQLAVPAFHPTPQQPKPSRPVMLSYAVQTETPKAPPAPTEAAKTGFEFKSAALPGTKASPAIDDTYMLMPGLLPLVLDTAIQSDLPGPLLAHLPGPVYSPKGVLLMEAGTQIIGRYETLGRNGSNRLLAVSTFAHTPNGIWVPLAGQSLADDLGRSGLDGAVDQHLLQRFGGAVLLTLSESLLGIVQAEVSKGGNTYLNLNTGSGVGSLSQQILQSTINIPPTFSKHQGETMALFIDQPISFADSSRLRAAGKTPS